jgi:hypothetical protein
MEEKRVQKVGSSAAKRLTHAINLGNEFGSQIQTWSSQNPIKMEPSIAKDRLSWTLTLTSIDPEPDLEEWSLIFGDITHNVRSALNNLLARIGQEEGLSEDLLRKLQFPITSSVQQWKNEKSRISGLPESVKKAIESVQPFQRSAEGIVPENDVLSILSNLSNQDKHRVELASSMDPSSLEHQMTIKFVEEPMDFEPSAQVTGDWTPGSVIFEMNTRPHAIKSLNGTVRWGAKVSFKTDTGNTYEPGEFLGNLFPYVETVLDTILNAWYEDLTGQK